MGEGSHTTLLSTNKEVYLFTILELLKIRSSVDSGPASPVAWMAAVLRCRALQQYRCLLLLMANPIPDRTDAVAGQFCCSALGATGLTQMTRPCVSGGRGTTVL